MSRKKTHRLFVRSFCWSISVHFVFLTNPSFVFWLSHVLVFSKRKIFFFKCFIFQLRQLQTFFGKRLFFHYSELINLPDTGQFKLTTFITMIRLVLISLLLTTVFATELVANSHFDFNTIDITTEDYTEVL